MSSNNVLRVNTAEERTGYRNAVSETIKRIIAEEGATLIQIAERIDVSLGTISNAFNGKTDLCPTYLSRLAQAYGPHALDPFAKLSGGRVVPLEVSNLRDVLPLLLRASHQIATARDPSGPGGIREIHTERFNYLPTLIEAQKALSSLICEIEAERAAA